MPKFHIMFDIDLTLLARNCDFELAIKHDQNVSHLTSLLHMSELYSNHYAINLRAMQKIFAALLANDHKIGFITSGWHTKDNFVPFIEKLYQLEENSLVNCVFINGGMYEDCNLPKLHSLDVTAKAAKLNHAKQLGCIPKDAKLLLIDDWEDHLPYAVNLKIDFIHATGFLPVSYCPNVDNRYLLKIKDICELNVTLTDEELLLTRSVLQSSASSTKYASTKDDALDETRIDQIAIENREDSIETDQQKTPELNTKKSKPYCIIS